jgi:cobaltochelatase CobN
MWNAYVPTLAAAARELPWLDLKVYSHRLVGENPEVLDRALQDMESAQFILLYRTPDAFWESVDQRLKKLADRVPLIATGGDPSLWTLSSVNLEIAANSYNYIIRNGLENFRRRPPARSFRRRAGQALGD